MPKENSDNKQKKSIKSTKTNTEEVSTTQSVITELPIISNEIISTPIVVQQIMEQVVEQVAVESENVEESNTELLFNKLINQFQDLQLAMKTLHSNMKLLQKEVLRERKESKKKESKIKKKSDKKKSPSGFAKPTPVSKELLDFLGLPEGDHIARTDVTTKVIAYVKQHDLQNPLDKKQIIPDEKLNNLLQAGDNKITFFNLQTYLKKHFLPNVTVTTEPTII